VNTTKRRRLPAARTVTCAAVLAVVAAAASCGTDDKGPRPVPAIPHTSRGSCVLAGPDRCVTPPLTQAQALAQIARYVQVNNRANALAYTGHLAQAGALNATIETGPLRAQSLAQYAELKVETAAQKKTHHPFYYVHSTVYVPSQLPPGRAQLPYFFAVTHESKYTVLLVFVEGVDRVWRNAAAIWTTGASAPSIAVDPQGYATAVDPDTDTLAMTPNQLPQAVNDNYITGGRGSGRQLAATEVAKTDRTTISGWNRALRPYVHAEALPDNDPYRAVWALKLTGGGALVIASRMYDQHFNGIPQPGNGMGYIPIPPHSDARTWVDEASSTNLAESYTCVDVAAIPPRGHGLTQQTGEDCEMVHAYG